MRAISALMSLRLSFIAATSTENFQSPPNIVWIMADDLGWGEPSKYPSTSSHGRISTPNLDQYFGEEGIIFTDAYAGYTVCAPSRTTFFSGRHSGQFVKYGFSGTELMPNQTQTVAEMLQSAGYATAAIGKTAPLSQPQEQGFDFFFGQKDQGLCHNMYPKMVDTGLGTQNVNLSLNYAPKSRAACMAKPNKFNYTVDMFQAQALQWLEQRKTEEQPFFLYLSFTVPHAGGWGSYPDTPEQGAPVPTDGQYTNESWPDVERDHASVITYLDNYVGQVVASLRDNGKESNTIVFFGSDNGAHNEGGHDHTFFNSTGGLRGYKRSFYEGGIRSPTMARWPGTIAGNVKSSFPFTFWDVMPTFAELSGGVVLSKNLDGVSVVPSLLGEPQKQTPREYVYHTWKSAKSTVGYGIRVDNWKGVVQECNSKTKAPSSSDIFELYDLNTDLFEATDISDAHPDVVRQLKHVVLGKNLTCTCYQC